LLCESEIELTTEKAPNPVYTTRTIRFPVVVLLPHVAAILVVLALTPALVWTSEIAIAGHPYTLTVT
jgi:hypothetical protein